MICILTMKKAKIDVLWRTILFWVCEAGSLGAVSVCRLVSIFVISGDILVIGNGMSGFIHVIRIVINLKADHELQKASHQSRRNDGLWPVCSSDEPLDWRILSLSAVMLGLTQKSARLHVSLISRDLLQTCAGC